MKTSPVPRVVRAVRLAAVLGPVGLAIVALGRALGRPVVSVGLRGYSAPVRVRPTGSDVGVLRQVFVARDCDVDVLSPRWIVDAGAYAGFTALFFAKKFPGARVIALEPSAENAALLRENTRHLPQVTVVEGALWHESGELRLEPSPRGAWATQVRPGGGGVRAWTIGELMAAFGIERIDLLKLDIEGAEREIFARAAPWLAQVDTLLCELHGPDCERAVLAATVGAGGWEADRRGEKVVLKRVR